MSTIIGIILGLILGLLIGREWAAIEYQREVVNAKAEEKFWKDAALNLKKRDYPPPLKGAADDEK